MWLGMGIGRLQSLLETIQTKGSSDDVTDAATAPALVIAPNESPRVARLRGARGVQWAATRALAVLGENVRSLFSPIGTP
jgi:hypothetical protein